MDALGNLMLGLNVVGTTSCSAYYMRYEGIPIEYIDSPNIDVINI